jgi:DNA-binding transcriptional regulator LsrR (DeoR family)
MAKRRELRPDLLYEVCDRFLKGEKVKVIADHLNDQLGTKDTPDEISREQVYRFLDVARDARYFWLRPPLEEHLRQRLADRYRVDGRRVRVVPVRGASTLNQVALEAAWLTLDLIKDVARHKASAAPRGVPPEPVHLGLGAGFSTRAVVQHLVGLLRTEERCPALVVHALSAGFPGEQPSVAPVAFFGLFDTLDLGVRYMGLFAPPMVRSRDYPAIKEDPGFKEAFDAATQIDIVISSLASAADEHGTLNAYLRQAPRDAALLRRAGWIGDLHYRPYSSTQPLLVNTERRAVTLFELADLTNIARTPHRHVVVMSAPCGRCGRTREDAVRPLLEAPELRVWTKLIIDVTTAERLLVDGDTP